MNFEEREEYIKPILDGALRLLLSKGTEYARSEDANANFKRIAVEEGLSPEQVCRIYLRKHLDALRYYADRLEKGQIPALTEPITGRVMDAVNYILILGSLIKEREKQLGVLG